MKWPTWQPVYVGKRRGRGRCLRDLRVVGRCTVSFHGGPFFIFISFNYDGWMVVMLPAAHSKLAKGIGIRLVGSTLGGVQYIYIIVYWKGMGRARLGVPWCCHLPQLSKNRTSAVPFSFWFQPLEFNQSLYQENNNNH